MKAKGGFEMEWLKKFLKSKKFIITICIITGGFIVLGIIGTIILPPDLTGNWASGVNTNNIYYTATIADSEIDVMMHVGDAEGLFWKGTYEAPKTNDEPYTWTSTAIPTNDGQFYLLKSPDSTKDFTYENNTISFDISVLGLVTHVVMERQY